MGIAGDRFDLVRNCIFQDDTGMTKLKEAEVSSWACFFTGSHQSVGRCTMKILNWCSFPAASS